MGALVSLLLTLAPMNSGPEVLGPDFLVCVRKPDSEELSCVEYDKFQAALRERLLRSPKKGEI
jgi:hypothetical protein